MGLMLRLEAVKPTWLHNHFFDHFSMYTELQLFEKIAKLVAVN